MSSLHHLYDRIANRCRRIETEHGNWPCKAGCDACCRSLASLPEMTEEEWQQLETATAGLPEEGRSEVMARSRAALAQESGPYVCPWLELQSGKCRVYEARPLACRTYGFYVDRDKGLYCGMITRKVEAGEMDNVVWGNQAAVEAGPTIRFEQRFQRE